MPKGVLVRVQSKAPFTIDNMKHSIYNIGGTVVKDNETYVLKDNTTLKNLVVSSTEVKAASKYSRS